MGFLNRTSIGDHIFSIFLNILIIQNRSIQNTNFVQMKCWYLYYFNYTIIHHLYSSNTITHFT